MLSKQKFKKSTVKTTVKEESLTGVNLTPLVQNAHFLLVDRRLKNKQNPLNLAAKVLFVQMSTSQEKPCAFPGA